MLVQFMCAAFKIEIAYQAQELLLLVSIDEMLAAQNPFQRPANIIRLDSRGRLLCHAGLHLILLTSKGNPGIQLEQEKCARKTYEAELVRISSALATQVNFKLKPAHGQ